MARYDLLSSISTWTLQWVVWKNPKGLLWMAPKLPSIFRRVLVYVLIVESTPLNNQHGYPKMLLVTKKVTRSFQARHQQCGYVFFQSSLGGGNSNIFFLLFGEDEPILTNIFQMGWNHQAVYVVNSWVNIPWSIWDFFSDLWQAGGGGFSSHPFALQHITFFC